TAGCGERGFRKPIPPISLVVDGTSANAAAKESRPSLGLPTPPSAGYRLKFEANCRAGASMRLERDRHSKDRQRLVCDFGSLRGFFQYIIGNGRLENRVKPLAAL